MYGNKFPFIICLIYQKMEQYLTDMDIKEASNKKKNIKYDGNKI